LKSKDIIELKRAVSKIKKTVDAMEGTIAGFGWRSYKLALLALAEHGRSEDSGGLIPQ